MEPQCRQILYQLSNKGSPGTLEGVAHPFSRGSSWPRKRAGVSFIAGDSLPAELPAGAGGGQLKKIKSCWATSLEYALCWSKHHSTFFKKRKERKGLEKLANQITSEVRESAFSIVYKILRTELYKGFPGGTSGKEPACQCRSCKRRRFNLCREDPLEEEMATHSSIFASRIPWTEQPGGLHSTESHRVGHNWSDLACTYA